MDTIIKILERYGTVYMQGLAGTLWLAAITVVLGTAVGTLLAVLRLSRVRVFQWFVKAYVWVLRGTPILLQLYFFWIFLPKVMPFSLSDTACIIVALIINASSYVAEIIRAGIQAVDKGQTEAARSLGLTAGHTMSKVVLPQAVKNILPALANEIITMVKESSVCSTYSMMELMWAAKNVAGTTGISVGPYVLVAAVYFCINFPASKAIEAIERSMRRGDKR